MSGAILTLNAGSSSLKFALFDAPGAKARLRGKIEEILVRPALQVQDGDGREIARGEFPAQGFSHKKALEEIWRGLDAWGGGAAVAAVGHRVVHGGLAHRAPVRIDTALLAELETLIPLAPLHQPHNLAPIRALIETRPDLPQIACFDTGFHRSQSELAQAFAIPRSLGPELRRYGFHGLSYEYIAGRLAELSPRAASGRVVVAHLGAGSSLCGMIGGKSAATTMGFTALDGLMMGTRCGAIDAGLVLHLIQGRGMSPAEVETLLYKKSGLLGVSGISPDMRTLRASADPRAREAIDLFVYRARREIGSLIAAIGGLDALVFTAGIGENDAATRAEIMAGFAYMGLVVDSEANHAKGPRLSATGSAVEAWAIPTDEEAMVAAHVGRVLG